MSRKFTRMRIVALILLIVVMTGVLVNGISNSSNFNWFSNRENPSWAYKNRIVREEGLSGVDRINFETDVGEVVLKTTDDNKIKVIERSNKKLKNNKVLNISRSGSELSFIEPSKFFNFNLFGFNDKKVVEIYLPKNYKEKLRLQTDVGDLYIKNDLELSTIDLASDVGEIISDKKIVTSNLNVSSDTGDIKFSRVESKDYNFESDVGKVVIERLKGKGSVYSDVGNVICNIEKIDGHMDFSTDVGNVILNIDKSQKFKLDADTGAGKVINNVSKNVYGDSRNSIKVRSDVGKVKLNYLD